MNRLISTHLKPHTAPRCVLIIFYICLASLLNQAFAQVPDKALHAKPLTMQQAIAYCDSSTLHNIEGIYMLPELNASVLVRSNHQFSTSPYELLCIESLNLFLPPGTIIGYLYPTGDPSSLSLFLYSSIKKKGISKPRKYAAKFMPAQGAITYQKGHKNITLNPLALIPRLNRLLRITDSNPAREQSIGLTRIYPPLTTSPATSTYYPRYF